jgi:hypothetical protein
VACYSQLSFGAMSFCWFHVFPTGRPSKAWWQLGCSYHAL